MAVTNAISSVIIVGALIASAEASSETAKWLGLVAVVLASVNIFGGFAVTERMLAMYKKRERCSCMNSLSFQPGLHSLICLRGYFSFCGCVGFPALRPAVGATAWARSDGNRVGNEWFSTCITGWSP